MPRVMGTITGLLLCAVASFAQATSPVVHRVNLELRMRDRSLLLPDGSYAGAAYQKALRRRAVLVKAIAGASVSNASISWAELGPDDVGGRINSVWVDPESSSHILAASASGGLWQSNDGGSTWAAVSSFPGSLTTSSLAELSNGTLLVGTGDFNTAGGSGILSSIDGGTTWLPIASTAPTQSALYWAFVNSLAVSANGVVLAATGISQYPGGIERSTDDGQTWTRVWPAGTGNSTSSSMDVTFDPENPNAAIADDQNGGVIYSTDGGQTWSAGTGLPGTSGARVAVAFDPSVGGSAYALVDNGGGGSSPSGQVYHSTDGGKSWTLLADTAAFVNELSGAATGALCDDVTGTMECQGWYDNVIAVLPHSTGSPTLVVGGIDIFSSTNGGTSWTETGDWINGQADYLHADQHAFTYDPANGLLYVGNDGGFYKELTANTWSEQNQGLADTQFYTVSGHRAATSSQNLVGGVPVTPILGGAQDNGSLLYEGYSSGAAPQPGDWIQIAGGDGGAVLVDPAQGDDIFGEAQLMDLYYSLQGGPNGQLFNPEPADSGSTTNFVAPLALIPNGTSAADQLLVGGASLWLGNDITAGSATWTAISAAGMPSSTANGNYISAVATDPANGNDVWVGYNDGEVYNSTDALSGTPAWTKSAASLPGNGPVSSFWVVPGTPGTVYVTFSSFISSVPGGNIEVTTDGGATWKDIGGTLQYDLVYSLVTHPADPQVLYAGTLTGIYTSTDGGETWQTTDVGPADVMVRQLSWFDTSSPDNPTLLAATFGRGVWMGAPAYYSTPTLASVSPSSIVVGSPATAITINGSGFAQSATTATLNGNSQLLTYVSSTELQAQLPTNLLANTGTLTLQLSNPPPGGGSSSNASINVVNPLPVLSSIAPSSVQTGAAATTLTVSGASFEPGSTVDWNGAPLTTTHVSSNVLSAVIPAADLTSAASATVTVVTPGPGGGTSSGATFTIEAPPHGGGGGTLGYLVLTLLTGANLLFYRPRLVLRSTSRRRTGVSFRVSLRE
jgi:photosystem II stability/assembly factor-like uncharacterized protein